MYDLNCTIERPLHDCCCKIMYKHTQKPPYSYDVNTRFSNIFRSHICSKKGLKIGGFRCLDVYKLVADNLKRLRGNILKVVNVSHGKI